MKTIILDQSQLSMETIHIDQENNAMQESQKSLSVIIQNMKPGIKKSNREFDRIDYDQFISYLNSYMNADVPQWTVREVKKLIEPIQRVLRGRNFGACNDTGMLGTHLADIPNYLYHEHLRLEKQKKMMCWKHVVCAAFGIVMPYDIAVSNWLTGMLISFIHLNEGDELLLDSTNNEELNICESVHPMYELSQLQLQLSFCKLLGHLRCTNRDLHAVGGMTVLNFHKLCCCFNGKHFKRYIGSISIPCEHLYRLVDVVEIVKKHDCNFFSMYSTSTCGKIMHYYSMWIESNDYLTFYDSLLDQWQLFSVHDDESSYIRFVAPLLESVPRTLFLFKIPYYESFRNTQILSENTTETLGKWTDHIIYNFMNLKEYGFENRYSITLWPSNAILRFDQDFLGDHLVIVKQSRMFSQVTGT